MTLLLLLRPSKESGGGPIPVIPQGGHFVPQYDGKRPWEKEEKKFEKKKIAVVETLTTKSIEVPSFPEAPKEEGKLLSLQLELLNNNLAKLLAEIEIENELELKNKLLEDLKLLEARKVKLQLLMDDEDFIIMLLH